MTPFNESIVELAALEWLESIGYGTTSGGDIAPGEPGAERASYADVLLLGRLRAALDRINAHIPTSARSAAIDEAIRRVQRSETQDVLQNNQAFHRLLVEGVDVSYREGGTIRHGKIALVDFERLERNDWLAVNQFTVTDVNPITRVKTQRRPDVVIFVNGLPLGVIELKNARTSNRIVVVACLTASIL